MIKAVIFDFDGVIGDTMADNCIAWQKAFFDQDFNLNPHEYYQLEGMGRFQIAEHFIEKYHLNPEIKTTVVEAKELNYKNNNTFKLYDEVKEIFRFLKQHSIKIAIVTGASKARIGEHMEEGIKDQLSALVTADDVKNTKPDPEPYLQAVNKLGLTPDECLVIENAILGIQSAKAANCKCFALETTLDRADLNQADEIFATHKELLIKFKEIIK